MASDQPQGSENYSVDEMMARLKRNERHKTGNTPQPDADQDGELITRDDGSQVVKVRRRKRRSKQSPKKSEPKTNPKLKWAILASIITLGLFLVVATVVIIAKYNGAKFKQESEATISEITGASNTEITQLRVTPVSAAASKAEVTWPDNGFLRSATFSNIKADIKLTSFFSTDWIGTEVVATKGQIELAHPAPTVEPSNTSDDSPYRFGSYRCNQLDIHFGSDKASPKIIGAQASMNQLPNESYQISFNGGQLSIPNWPELSISNGLIKPGRMECSIEARLAKPESYIGEMLLQGAIKKDTSLPVTLDVITTEYPLKELLGPLGRLIKGNVNSQMGSLKFDYAQPRGESLSFVLPFNSPELTISGFPFLRSLKSLTGNSKMAKPSITNCKGVLKRTAKGTSLNDLQLSITSALNITGNIHVATDGKLSGTLQIGIHQTSFSKAAPKVFTAPHDGLQYIKVTLGGTVHNPHDDLADQLKTTATQQAPPRRAAPALIPPSLQQERDFEELTR